MFHICLDLEMCELSFIEQGALSLSKETIQIGAALLDSQYKLVGTFSIFVKPKFGTISKKITELTGISEETVRKADEFVVAFEKYLNWIESNVKGEKFITYSWSNTDHKVLRDEIYEKARERTDFLDNLKSFVDLQRTFSEVLGTQRPIALDKAIDFCRENFNGNVHTADADAFNTAIILHKLCLGNFNPQFHYIHESDIMKIEKEKEQDKNLQQSYKSNMSSFFSPELLKKFGLDKEESSEEIESHDDYSNYLPPKLSKREKKLLKQQKIGQKKLEKLPQNIQTMIANHHPTLKYHINPVEWLKFFTKMTKFKANIEQN